MSYHSHSAAEWASFVSLGVGVWAAGSALVLLICDADLKDFDPRPAVRRALESPAADRLLVEVVNARHALREAAVSASALLLILSGPTGDVR